MCAPTLACVCVPSGPDVGLATQQWAGIACDKQREPIRTISRVRVQLRILFQTLFKLLKTIKRRSAVHQREPMRAERPGPSGAANTIPYPGHRRPRVSHDLHVTWLRIRLRTLRRAAAPSKQEFDTEVGAGGDELGAARPRGWMVDATFRLTLSLPHRILHGSLETA